MEVCICETRNLLTKHSKTVVAKAKPKLDQSNIYLHLHFFNVLIRLHFLHLFIVIFLLISFIKVI